MTCDRARRLLVAESSEVGLHLQSCPDCSRFSEGLERTQAALRSLRRDTITPAALAQMRSGLFSRLENPAAVLGWRVRLERFLLSGFRTPRYAIAGLALAAIVSVTLFAQLRRVAADPVAIATLFDGQDMLARPDSSAWMALDAIPHEERHHLSSGKAYIAPAAYREFTQTGRFPEGTVLVLKSSASLLASVKDSRFEGGWGYFEFRDDAGRPASKTSALPDSTGCAACHRDKAATDHVFTQFYPVLRSAAGVL